MKVALDSNLERGKSPTAKATVTVPAGDVKLRATVTDASILSKGPCLEGVVLALEKPDAFVVDYHVLKRDCHFKFMNTISVLEKPLKLTYGHEWCKKGTDLQGTLELDEDNKVSADCTLGSKNNNKYKLKYTYNHKGLTKVSSSYEVISDSWDLAVSQKLLDIHTLEASYKASDNNLGLGWALASKHNGTFKTSYHTSSKILGLKWLLASKPHGSFEINASLNLGEKSRVPNVSAKTTFHLEI
ncbi:outer envelope pore protein 24, chloroplastic-like [Neltuma alba]|uniref:outer envelope pore protein 24, chloroplastic-like n=1 Tax=Neltuma alba TaxID=207710 RepID=UPI0010A5729C|nr:outer envelope pore protein 24, chloroplastic-like [Prosopis alba]XP_028779030.1 outer envelope pore protein 24, chloroplastic-like [Prosopis alba]